MRLSTIWLTLGGLFVGFVIGFLVASSINRSEINQLRSDAESARSAAKNSNSTSDSDALSDEEIRDKIAEADRDPTNFAFQKNLGLALYRYGAIRNDTNVISESARLLERAAKLSPSDSDVVVGLGNAWFDLGYAKKDNASFSKAREWYQAALSKTPQDASVRTDIGMTYFLQDPPDDQKAVSEFKKALAIDPKNEKALQFIIQSLVRQGDKTSATSYLGKLRDAYPNNDSINPLTDQIQQAAAPPK
jgi:tetratricopeptide (TPR) repeat protein